MNTRIMPAKKGFYEFAKALIEKNLHRPIMYSMAGFVGFLLVELFTFIFFHYLSLPNLIAVPPSFLIAVAIEFLIDEFWTTRRAGIHSGSIMGVVRRLLKFEFVNLAGTSIAIFIQYLLYAFFGLTPLIGNIIGSGFAFPVNYYVQMRATWKISVV